MVDDFGIEDEPFTYSQLARGLAQELKSIRQGRAATFPDLTDSMARSLPADSVLDGEIVCLDRKGYPQFNDLLFRRGKPCFFAFDLLWMVEGTRAA